MGDPTLDKLFTGFGIIFGPMLVFVLLASLSLVALGISSFIDKIVEGFRLGAMLRDMKIYVPSDEATRDFVIRMRTKSDAARLVRLKKRRDEAAQALKVDLPDGLPAHMKYLDKEDAGNVDITEELFNDDAHFLVCRDPLGAPTFFHSLLPGRATETGVRDARFTFTAVRSMARRLTKAQAISLLPNLPRGGRDCFIVEDVVRAIEAAAVGVIKEGQENVCEQQSELPA